MSEKKRVLGQFFTKNNIWLKTHIHEFIESKSVEIIFDPFAGDGHILSTFTQKYTVKWFDIDANKDWEINDSLKNIPKVSNSVIITNPPYITNYSAKRKWVLDKVQEYFEWTDYEDLYQRALDKCLEYNDFVVAIIPETYINSWRLHSRLESLTIIEENPFEDTDCPVCVGCFSSTDQKNIHVYKNDSYIWIMEEFDKLRPKYDKSISIIFNDKMWRIWLRAVDGVNIDNPISFLKRSELWYSIDKIKISSRLMTFIEMKDLSDEQIESIIHEANAILKQLRIDTHDIIFSPFKWNNKAKVRRRRLDYRTARAILEEAYRNIYSQQITLF